MNSLQALNVLVVDDQKQSRELLQIVLDQLGVGHVFVAEDGIKAKDMLESFGKNIDMIICDWQMPNMSGHELLQCVRRDHGRMPFMMVTARSDPESVRAALSSGVTDYIAKPFSPDTIGKKISRLAGHVKTRRPTAVKWQ